MSRAAVPRVDLEATEMSALRGVELGVLRGFAVGGGQDANGVDGHNSGGTNGVNGVNGEEGR